MIRRELVAMLALDAVGVASVGMIAFGAWLAYPPAGFIVAGVLLLAGVLFLSRENRSQPS